MTADLNLEPNSFEAKAVSPMRELGAYEALWDEAEASFKRLSERFAKRPGSVPSDFVTRAKASEYGALVREMLAKAEVTRFGVRVHGAGEYPAKLRDAVYPIQLLYFQGWWDLVESRCIAVVGTRKPTPEGCARTRKLVKALIKDNFTVVSGLAAGIDTEAHQTAMSEGGLTIAVIGTPLGRIYPKENAELQKKIAHEFLVISQVPVRRYEAQDFRRNRFFFPERNKTMSALTEATIIVEASETSGTLVQARAALQQGRKLFILESCFNDTRLTWPHKFAERGAVRVKDYDDIRRVLSPTSH